MSKFLKKQKRVFFSPRQTARFTSLCLVVSFFTMVPYSNWYANNKIAFNNARLVELADGFFLGKLYALLNSFYSMWPDPVSAATSNNGSLWAFTVLGIPISDPLGLISELTRGVVFPLKYFLGALIPFALVLLFGRVFCGWLCPMTLLFGFTSRIRKLLEWFKLPLLEVKLPTSVRIFMLWLGMITSFFWGAWVWHFILPYISFSHEIFSYVVFSSFTVGIYFLIAVLVLDIGLIPGEFCRSVCPTGFLLSYLGKLSIFKLKVNESACPPNCSACKKACPYDLFPRKKELYSCNLCLNCVDKCPKSNIKLEPKVGALIKIKVSAHAPAAVIPAQAGIHSGEHGN